MHHYYLSVFFEGVSAVLLSGVRDDQEEYGAADDKDAAAQKMSLEGLPLLFGPLRIAGEASRLVGAGKP